MKAEKDKIWVGAADFAVCNPLTAKIEAIEQETNRWNRKVFIAHLRSDVFPDTKCVTITTTAKNQLIDKYGDETNAWIGKTLRITDVIRATDNKQIREVSPI